MKTPEQAKADLLMVMPYIQFAIEEASQNGQVGLAITRTNKDGSGKIECKFDASLIDDVVLLIGAPPLSEEARLKAKAAQFRNRLGLEK